MPVVGIKDVKEENDDDKRQAYYAGGQGKNGGGRCVQTRHPRAQGRQPQRVPTHSFRPTNAVVKRCSTRASS